MKEVTVSATARAASQVHPPSMATLKISSARCGPVADAMRWVGHALRAEADVIVAPPRTDPHQLLGHHGR
jgi:hypothetical protein